MSILSPFSLPLPPDWMIGREVPTSSLSQELLEKLPTSLDQKEELFPSNFKVILGNLNELQTSPLPTSKEVNGNFFSTSPAVSSPPCKSQIGSYQSKQDDSFSAPSSVVKRPAPEQQTFTATKQLEETEEPSKCIQEENLIEPKAIELQQFLKPEDPLKGEEMPIALTQTFIQDTLQEINNQQLRTLDQNFTLPVGSLGEGTAKTEVMSGLPQGVNPVQIEVQAAPTTLPPVLLEDTQQAILFLEEEQEVIYDVKEEVGEKEEGLSEESYRPATKDTISPSPKPGAFRVANNGESSAILASGLPGEKRIQDTQSISPTKGNISSTSSLFTPSSFSAATSLPSFNMAVNRSNLDRVNTLMQLKDHFQSMIKNQETHLKVNLLPAELGRIEITLDLSKDAVISTLIRAERRDTMEFLARHAEDLNQIFQEAGLQSHLTNMNFSSEEEAPPSPFVKEQSPSFTEEENVIETQDSYEVTDSDAWVNVKA